MRNKACRLEPLSRHPLITQPYLYVAIGERQRVATPEWRHIPGSDGACLPQEPPHVGRRGGQFSGGAEQDEPEQLVQQERGQGQQGEQAGLYEPEQTPQCSLGTGRRGRGA